ncbi:hypothetical protein VP424E501_P0133 [Vibrio phage 424E50-1]|nr:hypothetical protein VP424E501_P0133 [Vibrio phage 424E50-1]
MKTITITQPTRQIARNTIKQLKLSGKDCKLVDNGKGSTNRWNVLVIGRETLSIGRKPSTSCNHIGKREKTVQAYKWLTRQSRKSVDVFIKRSVNVIL